MSKKVSLIFFPFMSFLFLSAYLRSATLDVVYTDYIRLTNVYLKDVFSLKPYLSIDILTRIPINYFERILNVVLFSYSTLFDMHLGAFFLCLMLFFIIKYSLERELGIKYILLITLVVISLNKWEMLINGSGWVHFMAFSGFIYHYLLYNEIRAADVFSKKKEILLNTLPYIIILLIAGPYSAVYSVSIIMAYIFDAVFIYKKKIDNKVLAVRIISAVIPLLLYIISRHFSIEEHAGATSDTMLTVLGTNFILFIKLFIYSFASMVIGGENILRLGISDIYILILGIIVILIYIYALYINFRDKIYEDDIFPLLLIVSGGLNHVLISLSRWIFLNEYYSMSSRYALQFHVGIIGIILTLARMGYKNIGIKRSVSILILLIFTLGNLYTTAEEIDIAKYRKEYFVKMQDAAFDFENITDAKLSDIFLYHDGKRVRSALNILKDKKLNIFK